MSLSCGSGCNRKNRRKLQRQRPRFVKQNGERSDLVAWNSTTVAPRSAFADPRRVLLFHATRSLRSPFCFGRPTTGSAIPRDQVAALPVLLGRPTTIVAFHARYSSYTHY